MLRYSTLFSRPIVAAMLAGVALLAAACGPEPARPPTQDTAVPTTVASPAASTPTTAATGTAAPQATSTSTTVAATATQTGTPTETTTPTNSPSPSATPTITPVPTEAVLDFAWARTGLTGTDITSLALLPGGTNHVLAGGPTGVWSSSYDYKQWTKQNVKVDGRSVEVSIGSADVMYVASHTGCLSGLPITDFRTTDGGKTWQPITGTEAISIAPANSTEAYAATCTDVRKTTDSGATWTKLPGFVVPNFDPSSIAVSPDGQTVFVAFVSEGGTGAILRSTDGGKTVATVTPKLTGEDLLLAPGNLTYVSPLQGQPDVGGLYMTSFMGIWFLPDGSDDWKQLHTPTPKEPLTGESSNYTFFGGLFVDTALSADYNKPGPVIYTSLANPGSAGLTNIGVFRSTDGGNTWAIMSKGLEGKAVNALALAPHDPVAKPGMVETLLAATSDGIWSIPMPPPFR